MSYVNSIQPDVKVNYQIIDDWAMYYKNSKHIFDLQNPHEDFTQFHLKVEKKIFPSDVFFTGSIECSIDFINCFFQGDIVYYDITVKKKSFFRQCFCDGEFRTTKSTIFEDDFNIADFSVKKQVYIEGGSFQTCQWSFIDNGTVKINAGHFESLNLGYWGGGCFLKELSFHFPLITGFIKVSGNKTIIEKLTLFQFSSDISMAIEDISVNSITIYRFRNEKGFRIFNLKSILGDKPTEFAIAESYLGKAEFYSIDFTTFQNVYFSDVHLTECSFVNIKWNYDIDSFKGRGIGKSKNEEDLPVKISSLRNGLNESFDVIENLKSDPDVIEFFSKNREVFRQLKYANEKQGDIVNAQKFHSKEMLAYNRTLIFENNLWTKLIIKMSYRFSDFGQSFILPLIWLFIGHWFLLNILILSGHFKGLSIDFANANAAGFKMAFVQYFALINPLRPASFTIADYTIGIDLLMRIWSSYMLYNVIRASRRFIK